MDVNAFHSNCCDNTFSTFPYFYGNSYLNPQPNPNCCTCEETNYTDPCGCSNCVYCHQQLGSFPQCVLISPEVTVIHPVSYHNVTPREKFLQVMKALKMMKRCNRFSVISSEDEDQKIDIKEVEEEVKNKKKKVTDEDEEEIQMKLSSKGTSKVFPKVSIHDQSDKIKCRTKENLIFDEFSEEMSNFFLNQSSEEVKGIIKKSKPDDVNNTLLTKSLSSSYKNKLPSRSSHEHLKIFPKNMKENTFFKKVTNEKTDSTSTSLKTPDHVTFWDDLTNKVQKKSQKSSLSKKEQEQIINTFINSVKQSLITLGKNLKKSSMSPSNSNIFSSQINPIHTDIPPIPPFVISPSNFDCSQCNISSCPTQTQNSKRNSNNIRSTPESDQLTSQTINLASYSPVPFPTPPKVSPPFLVDPGPSNIIDSYNLSRDPNLSSKLNTSNQINLPFFDSHSSKKNLFTSSPQTPSPFLEPSPDLNQTTFPHLSLPPVSSPHFDSQQTTKEINKLRNPNISKSNNIRNCLSDNIIINDKNNLNKNRNYIKKKNENIIKDNINNSKFFPFISLKENLDFKFSKNFLCGNEKNEMKMKKDEDFNSKENNQDELLVSDNEENEDEKQGVYNFFNYSLNSFQDNSDSDNNENQKLKTKNIDKIIDQKKLLNDELFLLDSSAQLFSKNKITKSRESQQKKKAIKKEENFGMLKSFSFLGKIPPTESETFILQNKEKKKFYDE